MFGEESEPAEGERQSGQTGIFVAENRTAACASSGRTGGRRFTPLSERAGREQHRRVPSSVLIVDDHERFRRSARRMLELAGWTVIGEAADGAGALCAAAELEPELVLLDVGLPDVSGLAVLRDLRERAPGAAVVVISTRDSEDYRELARARGARGFLPKSELSARALEGLGLD